MTRKLNFGLVGSGTIAKIVANAIKLSQNAEIMAITSKSKERAQHFANYFSIPVVHENWESLIKNPDIDVIHIATPTNIREKIALTAIENHKHIIVEKPFMSLQSLQRIKKAIAKNSVFFIDGTHFIHHPRNASIKENMNNDIGKPQTLHTSFFFPSMDRDNIRFDTKQEPTGVVGDLGWYNMRAVVEYLQPTGRPLKISGNIVRDNITNAVIRGSGYMLFEENKSTTFDFGYNSGVWLMDLDIVGHKGMYSLNDFVLDWKNSFAFNNATHQVGYTKRVGIQSPNDFEYIKVDTQLPQEAQMINNFVSMINSEDIGYMMRLLDQTLFTQLVLDYYWNDVYKGF